MSHPYQVEGVDDEEDEDEYFIVPATECKVELLSLDQDENEEEEEEIDPYLLYQNNSTTDKKKQSKQSSSAINQHFRKSDSMRLNALELETVQLRSTIKSYSKELKFLLAQIQLLNGFISSTHGKNLINTSSMYYKSIHNWDEIHLISQSLGASSSPKLGSTTSEGRRISTRQTLIRQCKQQSQEAEEFEEIDQDNHNMEDNLGLDQDEAEADGRPDFNNDDEEAELLLSPPPIDPHEEEESSIKKSGRAKSIYWRYFNCHRDPENNKVLSNKCKKCGMYVSPYPERLRAHLLFKCAKGKGIKKSKISIKKHQTPKTKPKQQIVSTTALEELDLDPALIDPEESQRVLLQNHYNKLGGRKRSNYWIYFKTIRHEETGRVLRSLCRKCGKVLGPNISRLKQHLIICNTSTAQSQGQVQSQEDQEHDPEFEGENQAQGQGQDVHDQAELLQSTRNSSGGRKKSKLWNHFNTTRDPITGKIISNDCKKCGQHVSPQTDRLRTHIKLKCGTAATDPAGKKSQAHHSTNNSGVGGRKKSAFWAYFVTRRDVNGKILSNVCKICRQSVSGQANRMKAHVKRCTQGKSDQEIEALILNNTEQEDFGDGDDGGIGIGGGVGIEKNVGGRKRGEAWNYFNTTRSTLVGNDDAKIISNTCKVCGKEVSPNVCRMELHLTMCSPSTIPSKPLGPDDEESEGRVDSSKAVRKTTRKGKSGRYKSPYWSYFKRTISTTSSDDPSNVNEPQRKKGTEQINWNCLKCGVRVSGYAPRLKSHLIKCGVIQPSSPSNIDEHDEPDQEAEYLQQSLSLSEIEKGGQEEESPEAGDHQDGNAIINKKAQAMKDSIWKYFESKSQDQQQQPDQELSESGSSSTNSIVVCKTCSIPLGSFKLYKLIQHLNICQPSIGSVYATAFKKLNKASSNSIFRSKDRESKHKIVQCEECGKFLKGSLDNHMLIHTGAKPHQCTRCGKSFRRDHHLKFHVSTVHEGMKCPPRKRNNKQNKSTNDVAVPFLGHVGQGQGSLSFNNTLFPGPSSSTINYYNNNN